MNKKMIVLSVLAASAGLLGGAFAARAQLFPYTGTTSTLATQSSTAATASATPTSSMTSSTATATGGPSTMMQSGTPEANGNASSAITAQPVIATTSEPTVPTAAGQFIEITGLTVMSIPASSTGASTILAANPSYNTMTSSGGLTPANGNATVSCTVYPTEQATAGTPIACPAPPGAIGVMTTVSSTNPSGLYSSPYTIDVNAATQLYLRDRTPAALADFSPGDMINVFGYYTNDGTIQADIVRDLSTATEAPTGTMTGTGTNTTALQAELDQLKALVLQLESQLGIGATSGTASSSAMSTGTITAPSAAASSMTSAPMIPYTPPASTSPTSSGY